VWRVDEKLRMSTSTHILLKSSAECYISIAKLAIAGFLTPISTGFFTGAVEIVVLSTGVI